MYGEKIAVLDDPSFRFDNSFQYERWLQEQFGKVYIMGWVAVGIVDLEVDVNVMAEWDTPVESISIGTAL